MRDNCLMVAICCALLGVMFSLTSLEASTAFAEDSASEATVYTCSMHPQVRLSDPGNCPICSMPLIPTKSTTKRTAEVGTIELTDHARAMASVETAPVEMKALSYLVKAVGKISYDETSLATITTRVDGYAERLFVNFTGVEVNKGDHLAEVYSPELVVAQQELLISAGTSRPELLETTKIKLRRLGLADAQVNDLLAKRKVTERMTLLSPISGTVITRNITQNAAFKAGDALYQIANLDSVWAYLDIYESQLPWLRYGQHVTMSTEALPGRTFDGQVTFISPIVDDETRTIKIPVHIANKDQALKPGMFVSADIHATLNAEGLPAPTGAEGSYTCPMHPQILRESAGGSCPLCGMDLKRVPGEKKSGKVDRILAIPASAVLDSGTRKLVYVEKAKGSYESRDVTLGPKAGDVYPVLKGLQEGERVAIRGSFLLDSQAQVSGSPSLFYPQGAAASFAHQHGDSPDAAKPSTKNEDHSKHAPPKADNAGHNH